MERPPCLAVSVAVGFFNTPDLTHLHCVVWWSASVGVQDVCKYCNKKSATLLCGLKGFSFEDSLYDLISELALERAPCVCMESNTARPLH